MNLFMKIISLVLIFFAIRYWLLIVGVLDENARFDTMQTHWKVASSFFSIFYPIAALGLWGLSKWGVVIWFLAAGFELVMHLVYPQLFGLYKALVIFHIASMGTWLLYILIDFLDNQRQLLKENG